MATGAAGNGASYEWAYWGSDPASSRYSPLDQIAAGNFAKLQVMWRWSAANFGPQPDLIYRATPIYVNGKLYTVAGNRRAAVCIEPTTGETLWMFREPDSVRWAASTRKDYGKGVAFASVDGRPVIYLATPASYLWALDANTGRPIETFGERGRVDLHVGVGPYKLDPVRGILDWGDITTSSAPIVVDGVLVMGHSHDRGYYPENRENVPGVVRGYDARTGKMLWRFDPIPKKGDKYNETWENGSAEYTGNVSPWAPLSADPKLGLVYVPTDTPTNDYYGGSRHGMNVYGTSLLALEIKTGRLRWFYQFVHHDVWNHDIPDAPHLLDITVKGTRIPVVVQPTKQGWLYVFNRETGEPVWPIEERPVKASDVPHEKLWPTQPHVTWPPPFEQQGVTEDDLIDFTPALRKEALAIAKNYRMQKGMFNPPSLVNAADGTQGRLHGTELERWRQHSRWRGGRPGNRVGLCRFAARLRGDCADAGRREVFEWKALARVGKPRRQDHVVVRIDRERRARAFRRQGECAAAADEAALRPHRGLRHEQRQHHVQHPER